MIHRIDQISMSHAAFTLTVAGSAPGYTHFRGHLRVRSRYGLVIRNHPSDGVVDRLQSLGFPPLCYPSYEAPDSCLGRSSLLNVSTFLDAQPDVQISRIRLSDRTSRLRMQRRLQCLNTSRSLIGYPISASLPRLALVLN